MVVFSWLARRRLLLAVGVSDNRNSNLWVSARMSREAWSDRKSCATCSRDMSVDDAHKRCQPCRKAGGYLQSPEYHAQWQRKDRQINGRFEERA